MPLNAISATHDLRRSCARFCHAVVGELDRFNSCLSPARTITEMAFARVPACK